MRRERSAKEVLEYIMRPYESYICQCGATMHVFYDRPHLTYRHGEGEAILELPDYDDSDEDEALRQGNITFDDWLERIHAYESRLTVTRP